MRSSGEAGPRLILGLGNPGERYRRTRHNLGFRVVDEMARRRRIAVGRLECNSLIGIGDGLVLAKPQTYMNRSGYAARCLVERRGFSRDELLVAYDEVHLPLGRLRLRPRGGPGGHRGMESVIENLRSEEFPRLRLGIGAGDLPAGDDLVEFVLSPFAADELEAADELVRRAADACECWLAEGVETAMNRFNG